METTESEQELVPEAAVSRRPPMTERQIKAAVALHLVGLPLKEIARRMGYSRTRVGEVIQNYKRGKR